MLIYLRTKIIQLILENNLSNLSIDNLKIEMSYSHGKWDILIEDSQAMVWADLSLLNLDAVQYNGLESDVIPDDNILKLLVFINETIPPMHHVRPKYDH